MGHRLESYEDETVHIRYLTSFYNDILLKCHDAQERLKKLTSPWAELTPSQQTLVRTSLYGVDGMRHACYDHLNLTNDGILYELRRLSEELSKPNPNFEDFDQQFEYEMMLYMTERDFLVQSLEEVEKLRDLLIAKINS